MAMAPGWGISCRRLGLEKKCFLLRPQLNKDTLGALKAERQNIVSKL